MKDYYGDNDPRVCEWMRELIKAGLVPTGDVHEQDIANVKAKDLQGYRRHHFFSGIAGWALALELAGWPAARPVWTGSCPCQPFSPAGKGEGEADERHLWPAWFSLIRVCRPHCIFGEQVGGKDGYRWLDGVRTDLESEGYAFGAADLPAACVGSPHIRQRLFWCAKLPSHADANGQLAVSGRGLHHKEHHAQSCRSVSDSSDSARQRDAGAIPRKKAGVGRTRKLNGNLPDRPEHGLETSDPSDDAGDGRRQGRRPSEQRPDGESSAEREQETIEPRLCGADGFWRDFDIIHYRDGKTRRVEPGTFPLAHGVSARLVKLRGFGNAIVPQVAATFIRAFLEAEAEIKE